MDQSVAPLPSAAPLPRTTTVPLGEIAPWALLVGVIALLALYFVGAEEGAVSLVSGGAVHELVHDARHLLGFPCH